MERHARDGRALERAAMSHPRAHLRPACNEGPGGREGMGAVYFWRRLCAPLLVGVLLLGAPSPVHGQSRDDQSPPLSAYGGALAPDLFTGGLTESIPIDAPPGRHGIQPALTLDYRSDRGNGWVGAGWELSLGSIERKSRTGVDYGKDDYVLHLAGATLDLVKNGSVYVAVSEGTFYLIQQLTDLSGDPFWQVTDKLGIRYLFGETTASRQNDTTSTPPNPSHIFQWYLDQVIDPQGNYLTASYAKDQGQIYLDEIDYTGCCSSAPPPSSMVPPLAPPLPPATPTLSPKTTVKFYLDNRPDVATDYTPKFWVTTTYRLKTITVTANGSAVRAYKLTYQTLGTPARSQLQSVQQFGSDATLDGSNTVTGGTALPATLFDYQPSGTGWRTSTPSGPAIALPVNAFCLSGDLNGDNKADMWCETGNYTGRWTVALSTGSGWAISTWTGPPISLPVNAYCFSGDLNDDQMADMWCETGNNTGVWTVALSTGSGWTGWPVIPPASPPTWSGPAVPVDPNPQPQNPPTPILVTDSCLSGDLDGDGKADMWCETDSTAGTWTLALSQGNGWITTAGVIGPAIALPVNAFCLSGDLDGDGKADMWCETNTVNGTWTVARSQGNRWTTTTGQSGPAIDTPVSATCLSGDLDGDAKADMWCETGDSSGLWTVALSSWGPSFNGWSVIANLKGPFFTTPLTDACQTGDLNGDRRMDMWCETGTKTAAWGTALSAFDQFAPLASMANGIGGLVTVTYGFTNMERTVNGLSVCDHGAGATCGGVTSYTSYAYAGDFYYSPEHEFRGFNDVTVTGPMGPGGEQRVTETRFHQGNDTAVDVNDPTCGGGSSCVGYMKGKPYRVQVRDGLGNLYSEQMTTYATDPSSPSAWHFNPPIEVDTSICDGSACGKQTRVIYKSYDAYGNLTEEDQYGDLSVTTDDRTITYNYSPSPSNWIVGLPTQETIYKGISTAVTDQVSQTTFYYDDLNGCTASPTGNQTPIVGNLTRVVRWLSGGSNPETRSAFDLYGNPICTHDAKGNQRTITYDVSSTFPTVVTDAMGYQTTTQYYGVNGVLADTGLYGQVKSVTDPNGAVTATSYDALGRTQMVKFPDNSSTSYSYNNYGAVGSQNVEMDKGSGLLSSWTYFDGLGRTIKEMRTGPDSKNISVLTQYNPTGTVAQRSIPHFDAGQTTWKQFQYDPVGRVIRAINPDGTGPLNCEDDWVSVTIDANHHRTRTIRDAYGRVVEIDNYLGNYGSCTTDAQSPYAVTQYQYDVLGDLRWITDAGGNQTEMRYDSLKRKIYQHDPDRGDSYYQYDDVGNLTQQVDADGQIVQMTYDALNRILTKQYHGVDSTPPSAPSNLKATAAVNGDRIDLTWTASTDDTAVVNYQVSRCQGASCSNFALIATTSDTAYSDSSVGDAAEYCYKVAAVDPAGNHSADSTIANATTPDTTPPTMPTGLTATASAGQITLAWTASTDNVGVTGYQVERCQGTGCSTFSQVGIPTTPGFIDTGISAQSSYSYRVLAVDAAGNQSPYACCASVNIGWTGRALMPTPRARLAVGVINNILYAVGGANAAGPLNTVEAFDPSTNSWTTEAPMPTARADLAVGVVNGILYAVGGSNVTASALATVEAYDPSTGSWTTKTPLPSPRAGLAVGVANDGTGDKLYAVDGNDATGTPVGTIYKYDPSNDFPNSPIPPWSLADPNRIPRYEAVVGVVNDALPLLIAGGSNSSGMVGDVEAYNPGTATVPAELPTPRGGLGAGVVNGQFYTMGGVVINTIPTYMDTVEAFDPSTNSWTSVLPLAASRTGLAVGMVNNVLYAVGGYNGGYLGMVEAYFPTSQTDITPPSDPTGLTATASGASEIDLSWTGSTDNIGVANYQVERCQGSGCSAFVQIAAPTATILHDTGLSANTSYSYRLLAVDGAGNKSIKYSNTATAATTPDTTNPTAPSNLTAAALSSTRVNLTWTASTDDVGIATYKIARCEGQGCSPSPIATPSITIPSYGDTGLDPGASYSYQVMAVDPSNNPSGYSNIATVFTPVTPPSNLAGLVVSSTQVVLNWTAAASSATLPANPYQIQRCQGAGCTAFTQIAAAIGGTSFTDSGLAAGATYRYRVRAVDAANNLSDYSNIVSLTLADSVPPTAPSNVTATAISDSQINLAWDASVDAAGVTAYQVERCQGTGCTAFAQVGTSASTRYTDDGLAEGVTYQYRLRAVDAVGNQSAYSNTAGDTTVDQQVRLPSNDQNVSPLWVIMPSGSTTLPKYLSVSESIGSPDDDANFLESQIGTGNDAIFGFEPFSIPSSATGIVSVQVTYVAKANGGAGDLQAAVKVNGTVYAQTSPPSQFLTTLWTRYNYVWMDNPATGLAWTLADINGGALQGMGVVSGNGDVSVTQIYLTVKYSPDNTPPQWPNSTPLTGVALNHSTVALAWTPATDDVAVASYHIERCQGAGSGCSPYVPLAISSASGNSPPVRTIIEESSLMSTPSGLYVDTVNNEIGVVNRGADSITVYGRTDAGLVVPVRTISGLSTGLSGPAGIYVDTVNDEIGVVNSTANSVTIYRRTDDSALGPVSPLRTISGPNTGLSNPSGVYVDTVNNEIGVVNNSSTAKSVTIYNRMAAGDAAPLRTISGPSTGLSGPAGIYVDTVNNEIGVSNGGNNSVTIYVRTANGNAPAQRTLKGASTKLSGPAGIYVDTVNNEIGVVNKGVSSVTIYNRTANGNVGPLRTLSGGSTGLNTPAGIAVDTVNNEISVANSAANSVTIYMRTASGNTAPLRALTNHAGVYVDTVHNEIGVVNGGVDSVTIYARTATESALPLRTLSGPSTGLSHPTGIGVYVDPNQSNNDDEISVVNSTANSVTTYRRTDDSALGPVSPLRTISGTVNTGLDNPVGMYVDPVNNEIGVVNNGATAPSVTIYSRTANGDVAPLRTLSGPSTGLSSPDGIYVDTINNEIGVANSGNNSVTIYSRTANGDVAPLRTISGPSTGLGGPAAVYVDNVTNLIGVVNSTANSVTLYPRTADGDLMPVRMVIGSHTGLSVPAGIYVDTLNNEFGVINSAAGRITIYGCTATFCDTGLPSLTTYTYQVQAVDLAGNTSLLSNSATVTTPLIPGDVNSSGRVDGADLILLSAAFGSTSADPNWNANADLDLNGRVDGPDLTILTAHYGEQ